MNTAQIILQQLGGAKFMLLTGSKFPVDLGNGLRLKLARNRGQWSYLDVTLVEDTYTMTFKKWSTAKCEVVKSEVYEGVYADMLSPLFEAETGLYTHF